MFNKLFGKKSAPDTVAASNEGKTLKAKWRTEDAKKEVPMYVPALLDLALPDGVSLVEGSYISTDKLEQARFDVKADTYEPFKLWLEEQLPDRWVKYSVDDYPGKGFVAVVKVTNKKK